MKVKKVTLKQLEKIYEHPSVVLFRYIELKAIYETCKNIKFKGTSMDLGCGDGVISSLLFDEKFTYGLDNGEAQDYQEAIDNKRYKKVILESAEKMSLKSNTVDFVFSNSVVEHIPNADAVISEVYRVLKKGGKYLFTVPTKYFSDYLLFGRGLGPVSTFYKKIRNKLLNHYHLYDFRGWKNMLESQGFTITDRNYYLNKKSIKLWDKMAWEMVIKKITKSNNKACLKKYKSKINKISNQKQINLSKGAGLLILCEK